MSAIPALPGKFVLPILALLFLAGCAHQPIAEVGDRAPAFEFPDITTDRPIGLNSGDGEFVVLNFWSTSCATCIKELPDLNQVHKDKTALVIGISLDEDIEQVQRVVREKEIAFDVVMGNQELFEQYDGFGIPYTLILDKNQRIRKRFRGEVSREEIVKVLGEIEGRDDAIPGQQ